jgi:hypothetical protein
MVPPIIIEPPRVISPIKSKMTKKEKLVLQLTMIKEIVINSINIVRN